MFSNQNNLFANAEIIGVGERFSSKVPVGGLLNKKG